MAKGNRGKIVKAIKESPTKPTSNLTLYDDIIDIKDLKDLDIGDEVEFSIKGKVKRLVSDEYEKSASFEITSAEKQ